MCVPQKLVLTINSLRKELVESYGINKRYYLNKASKISAVGSDTLTVHWSRHSKPMMILRIVIIVIIIIGVITDNICFIVLIIEIIAIIAIILIVVIICYLTGWLESVG